MFSSIELLSNMKDLFAQQQLLSLFLGLGSLFLCRIGLCLIDNWILLLFIVTLLQAMLYDRSTQTISNSLHRKPLWSPLTAFCNAVVFQPSRKQKLLFIA